MKVIVPTLIDSATLTNSNIPEPDAGSGEIEYVPVDQGGGTIGDKFTIGSDIGGDGDIVGVCADDAGNTYVGRRITSGATNYKQVIVSKFDPDFVYIGQFTTSESYLLSSCKIDVEKGETSTPDILITNYEIQPTENNLVVNKYASPSFDSGVKTRNGQDNLSNFLSYEPISVLAYSHTKHTTGQWQNTVIYGLAGGLFRSATVRSANVTTGSSLVHDNPIGAVSGDISADGLSMDINGGKYLIFSRNIAGDTTYIQEYNSTFSTRTKTNSIARLTEKCLFGVYLISKYVLYSDPTVLEAEFSAYNVKTNYQYGEVDPGDPVPAGSVFIKASTHRKYEAVVDTTLDPIDGVNTIQSEWVDIGPTNRYSAFDGVIGNISEHQDEIIYTIRPQSQFNSISGFNVSGAREINVTMRDSSGVIVYDNDIVMRDNSEVTNWYQYFFSPIIEKSQFSVNDLPTYGGSSITLTIIGTGQVSIGEVVIGRQVDLGVAEYGTSLQLLDFSSKVQDNFGNFEVIRRGTSKLVNYDMNIQKNRVDYVFRKLASITTIPCVWVGVDEYNDATTVYGYYKDSTINIDSPSICSTTISVEGLV
ncbi:hypothetical protein [Vibrio casei]|uniref:hypothetical protein n=1 Tax=Vibrio casei TaxID=673372 RepID=UPI003F99F8F4